MTVSIDILQTWMNSKEDEHLEKPVEMYDCQNDPCELNNVFEDPDLESVRRDLIDTHLSAIRDRLDREKLEIYRATPAKTYSPPE